MSFSAAIKKDLSALIPESEGSMRAELSGIIASAAAITVDSSGATTFLLRTDHPAVGGRIYKLIKNLYGIRADVQIRKTRKFKEHRSYTIRIDRPEDSGRILKDVRILRHNVKGQTFFVGEVPGIFLSKQDYIKSYIRGVFMMSGSIANPEKSWHLELVGRQKSYLTSLRELLSHYDIKANIIKRKTAYVLYVKESESLSYFLNLIGAHKALLEIENIRIMKGVRGEVNRQVNCETANMNKTAAAAASQTDSIRFLIDQIGFDRLPPNLRSVAEARLNHPDLSIKELGAVMTPPLGKSGIYHRLKKLMAMAEEIRGSNA